MINSRKLVFSFFILKTIYIFFTIIVLCSWCTVNSQHHSTSKKSGLHIQSETSTLTTEPMVSWWVTWKSSPSISSLPNQPASFHSTVSDTNNDTTNSPLPDATTSLDLNLDHGKDSYNDSLYTRFPARTFTWDKKKMNSRNYQESFCSNRCKDEHVVSLNDIQRGCLKIGCIACNCNRPACEVYGICCPDVNDPYFEIEDDSYSSLVSPTNGQKSALSTDTITTIDSLSQDSYYRDLMLDVENVSQTVPVRVQTGRENDKNDNEISNMSTNKFHKSSEMANRKRDQDRLRQIPQCDTTSFLYIRSCPRDFPDHNMTWMCQHDFDREELTETSYVRVSDNETHVVYYNEYCAKCNGVRQILPWELNFQCVHMMYVYKATNGDELLRLSLSEESTCTVTQNSPVSFPLTGCSDKYFSDAILDTCNQTGLWSEYDEDIEKACEGVELSLLAYRVAEEDYTLRRVFKNIFCYICNLDSYPTSSMCPGVNMRAMYVQNPPISMLLNFRYSPPESPSEAKSTYQSPFIFNVSCSEREWSSPNGQCLPLQCSPGKLLDGVVCRTALDNIRQLGYALKLWLIPDGDHINFTFTNIATSSLKGNFLVSLHEKINMVLFEEFADVYLLETGIIFHRNDKPEQLIPKHSDVHSASATDDNNKPISSNNTTTPDTWFLFAFVKSLFIYSGHDSRDVTETRLVQKFLNTTITINLNKEIDLVIRPSATITVLDSTNHCNRLRATDANTVCMTNTNRKEHPLFDILNSSNLFLNVTNLLSCSYLEFTPSQYVINHTNARILPEITITLDLKITKINFSEISEFNQIEVGWDGTLRICHDLLDQKLSEIEEIDKFLFYKKSTLSPKTNLSIISQYILTMICLVCSIICLFLTLITYFRFNVLRSAAGMNNIFLCSSLLLAQAILLVASHVGSDSPACTVIGVATHFLWLWMICWSFLCCYHMYKVFTAKTRSSHSTGQSQLVQLRKNIGLSLTVPTVIVVAVLVVSYLTSGRERIGYGYSSCYLDSGLLIGVSFIGPLVFVILCNIIFFSVTVVKIQSVRKLQSQDSFKKNDRQDFSVYIKLSTLTGVFWIMSIIAEAADVDVLRFIAILLNGSQGVFIFISYICNMRVLNLYLRSFALKPLESSFSERSSRTEQSSLWKLINRSQKGKIEKDSTSEPYKICIEESHATTGPEEASLDIAMGTFKQEECRNI